MEYHPLCDEDSITTGLLTVVGRGSIDDHVVFKARVLLDIHRIMGASSSDAYEALLTCGATIHKDLGITWGRDPETVKLRSGCVQTRDELLNQFHSEDNSARALQLSTTVRKIVHENSMVEFKRAFMEAGDGKSQENIPLNPDPAFYFKHNPVYSGVESLELAVDLENLGVDLANSFASLAAVAHIYNCLQQTQRLKGRWHSLDKAINVNMSALFLGDFPITNQQIQKRFLLCIKIPSSTVA